MGERQEQLSQLYERRVVRKARASVHDNSHVLAKCYEQCVCVCVCVCVCKLRKLLVCLICNFYIFSNCSLRSKICCFVL